MKRRTFFSAAASLFAVLMLAGCGKVALVPTAPGTVAQIESTHGVRSWSLSREQENRILSLNPERVSDYDVRHTLAGAPAPHIINIHGGLARVIQRLESFARFLSGLGYPEKATRNAGNGSYTISCYEDAEMFAGIIAWYYEHEGMRPMLITHSQGGFQAIKALEFLSGQRADRLTVWSPLTWKPEERTEITDPLTGKKRPVVGLGVSYIATLGTGGATRVLPNQWDMIFSLRTVPDAVDEFTGFYLGLDFVGGDYLGFGPANKFKSAGRARVRNVQLPASYSHGHTPDLERLVSNPRAVEWINNYVPSSEPKDPEDIGDVKGISFGADVWKSVKRHWVIELQRLIRAHRAMNHGR
jgi:hypothetical protein